MRQLWIALFCIVLSMSGSLIPVSHMMAHAQPMEMFAIDPHDGGHHGNDAHDEDRHDGDPEEHHEQTGHTSDHAAELHLTALGVSSSVSELPLPNGALRSVYSDLRYPAPLLPPDPDPDRT